MSLLGYVAVLIVGIIIGVFLANPNTIQQLENFGLNLQQSTANNTAPTPPEGQSVLNACLSKINSGLQIAEAKLPSGTSVSIVNSTIFYYDLNSGTTIDNINSWIVLWNSGYGYGGSESCKTYYPNLFVCSDLSSLSTELNNTSNLSSGSVVGAGVAVKFQFPPEAQSNGYTEVSPFLCDPSGVMPSSYSYLIHKSPYS